MYTFIVMLNIYWYECGGISVVSWGGYTIRPVCCLVLLRTGPVYVTRFHIIYTNYLYITEVHAPCSFTTQTHEWINMIVLARLINY
jgi:hypothetical protein